MIRDMDANVARYLKMMKALFPSASGGGFGLGSSKNADCRLQIEHPDLQSPISNLQSSISNASSLSTRPPPVGEERCDLAWDALARFRADRSGIESFDRIIATQHADGSFFGRAAHLSVELQAYYELVLLHALASYAIESRDLRAHASVTRAADFHVNETQPDHATTQPWAIHAFIIHPPARILADQMLHALRTQPGSRIDPVSLLVLGDALYSLRQLA